MFNWSPCRSTVMETCEEDTFCDTPTGCDLVDNQSDSSPKFEFSCETVDKVVNGCEGCDVAPAKEETYNFYIPGIE